PRRAPAPPRRPGTRGRPPARRIRARIRKRVARIVQLDDWIETLTLTHQPAAPVSRTRQRRKNSLSLTSPQRRLAGRASDGRTLTHQPAAPVSRTRQRRKNPRWRVGLTSASGWCASRSINQPFRQPFVSVDASVAQERPVAPHLFDPPPIAL